MEEIGIDSLYDLENQNNIFEKLKTIAMNLEENKSDETSETIKDANLKDINEDSNKEDMTNGNGVYSNSATEDNELSRDKTENSNHSEDSYKNNEDTANENINDNSNEKSEIPISSNDNSNEKSEKSTSSSIDKTLENLNSLIDFNKRLLNNTIQDDPDVVTENDPLASDDDPKEIEAVENDKLENNLPDNSNPSLQNDNDVVHIEDDDEEEDKNETSDKANDKEKLAVTDKKDDQDKEIESGIDKNNDQNKETEIDADIKIDQDKEIETLSDKKDDQNKETENGTDHEKETENGASKKDDQNKELETDTDKKNDQDKEEIKVVEKEVAEIEKERVPDEKLKETENADSKIDNTDKSSLEKEADATIISDDDNDDEVNKKKQDHNDKPIQIDTDNCADEGNKKNQSQNDEPIQIDADEDNKKKQGQNDEPIQIDADEDNKKKQGQTDEPIQLDADDCTEDANKEKQDQNDESVQPDADDCAGSDAEMDDDFNPLLLCPDISMDVDESPVITNNDPVNDDGTTSPLPYEQSFSTYVDEMTGAEVSFNLTKEEQDLRLKMYGAQNPVEFTKIHCTACNVHLGSALEGQKNRFVHPLLKVLICKDCYHFYTSGEFEKDEDGSELYCRWCGQGGQVLCCSRCEFVFCKKCIRNNFGRRKLSEIKDSEEWFCFRCDPKQLIYLRATCAEFFEYVRREISRAATLNDAAFWTLDHCRCCPQYMKKHGIEDITTEAEEKAVQPPKKKRKNNCDPDYNPHLEDILDTSKIKIVNVSGGGSTEPVPSTSGVPASKTVQGAGFIKIMPTPKSSNNTPLRIGNTVMVMGKPAGKIVSQPQPKAAPTTIGQVRVTPQNPGYTRIPPTSTPKPTQMKHEWFEKTVRASARVNSNLSYTLTQLNKAQANAGSIEALATVHNKLQEILSTSINSLIQIRKNLRTEFIAGIKTIRFPPKQVDPKPVDPNDDDVILVSSTPSTSKNTYSQLSSEVSLISTAKPPPPLASLSSSNPPQSSSYQNTVPTSNVINPRQYIKVRSFSQLQNVTSECIIIPDDPVPPKENGTDKQTISVETDSSNKAKLTNGDADGCIIIEDEKETEPVPEKPKEVVKEKSKEVVKQKSENKFISYNVKEIPTPEIQRMLSVKVKLPKYQEIDKIIKQKGFEPVLNGGVS